MRKREEKRVGRRVHGVVHVDVGSLVQLFLMEVGVDSLPEIVE